MVIAWRNFKIIFPRPHFIIIFRPEMLKFHPYSILTGDTRVESVIYSVLIGDKKRISPSSYADYLKCAVIQQFVQPALHYYFLPLYGHTVFHIIPGVRVILMRGGFELFQFMCTNFYIMFTAMIFLLHFEKHKIKKIKSITQ